MNISLSSEEFHRRHIGPNDDDARAMLATIGVQSLDQLIDETVPASIRMQKPMNLSPAVSEYEVLRMMTEIAQKNTVNASYIGLGYYGTITPPVIQRNILENPGWYTQYTPYQAEIAQGRLEAMLNFQTMVVDLTAMQVTNASLLDEATAAAEAMTMLHALKGSKNGDTFFISENCFPQTIDVVRTRAQAVGIRIQIGDHKSVEINDTFFGTLVQYPGADGSINEYADFCSRAKSHGVLVAVAADLLSLTMLTAPGEFGADVVVGSAQRFGVPMGYGGPHAAFLATKDEYKRQMPGRIIGVSIDAQGNKAYRMSLQTREQHIRREKATSNICTAQALLAVMASMYGVYHGPAGLYSIASRIHGLTKLLSAALTSLGYRVKTEHFFDTITIQTDELTEMVRKKTLEAGSNIRIVNSQSIGLSMDETTTVDGLHTLLSVFASVKNQRLMSKAELQKLSASLTIGWKPSFIRKSKYMQHPVFQAYHSETEMLRYIHSLETKDLSLNYSMIALGSCTMKLNATTEMLPVTMPEYSLLHPFAPMDQAKGYQQVFAELSHDLKEITGFAGVSLQPNAGAQGEYTGLMVVREYFKHRQQPHRNVALIPSSAHGTNPASAVMAGLKVVVVQCDEKGNIDIADLKVKAEQHRDTLAVLMVTYPSTHGVFEEGIREMCAIVHANGGQVYMDGANMNAQVGLTSPALIGADVCHLNLHKTFSIPHGGGGPGMGPICVAQHLVPFLPGHAVVPIGSPTSMGAVSAAPWGSASVLLISYAYIKMMGSEGLTRATKYAILNANYIKARLETKFIVLFVGSRGRVGHEMIVDMRSYKSSAGVEVEDIAKRLIDYGFHAPTVSFPVAGTIMVEPTESESKAELDRFCDALLSIHNEMQEIESGRYPTTDNVLKNAPHTARMVIADEWTHPYSRGKAAFPTQWIRDNKFWPSVARINNTYGDRQLVCTCPPVEDYEKKPVA